jgi:polynucleotide 5'-hydroxyl-kinase GRC3/NOL9
MFHVEQSVPTPQNRAVDKKSGISSIDDLQIMNEQTIQTPHAWREAADEIAGSGGSVIVLGAPGSGKTTFCRYLAGHCCRRGQRVAWIDADPGQPCIGPPAVFSLSLFSDADELLKHKHPLAMGFIGNTSPVGHLIDAVTNIEKLHRRALHIGADLVVVNTCGLVQGGAARELTFNEIDIIEPRYVVAIQEKNEIEHLIAPHSHRADLLVQRLPLSPGSRILTSEARRAYREKRFKEYFRGADYQDIALSDVGIHGPGLGTGERLGFRDINILSKTLQSIVVHAEMCADRLFLITEGNYSENELYTAKERYGVREVTVVMRSEFDYLLVGLNDDRNLCLALGVVREIDLRELALRIVTPCRDISPVRHLALGSLRVNPAGGELGQW